jgi:hypothetical protein
MGDKKMLLEFGRRSRDIQPSEMVCRESILSPARPCPSRLLRPHPVFNIFVPHFFVIS